VLVHLTFPFAFEHIHRLGLRSATQLVSDAGLQREDASAILTSYRREPTELKLADGTLVVLRNQIKNRRHVVSALCDLTEAEWLNILNERVYLFPATHRRVRELVNHYTTRGFDQDLISFDTFPLLAAFENRIEVALVNSGVFPRTDAPQRGRDTFVPLSELPVEDLAKVQEVTVKGTLPIRDGAVRVVERHLPGGGIERVGP
jgi:hypothetical protein